jgi:hypothetical protein
MQLKRWSSGSKKYTRMKNEIVIFSIEQGNLLVRLLLAHIITDFVLQWDKMVACKTWFSKYMLLHITLVFITTYVLSGLWQISLVIALFHWVTDSLKVEIQTRTSHKSYVLFLADQFLHFVIILLTWFWHYHMFDKLLKTVSLPFVNYQWSIVLLAYVWIYYPVGYIIKLATQSIAATTQPTQAETENKVERGGKIIGQYERIIILTLVLLNQYEAIGFLITGKSIIRFADHNSNLRSEYVLVGTMMSYALAILTGVLVNYVINI